MVRWNKTQLLASVISITLLFLFLQLFCMNLLKSERFNDVESKNSREENVGRGINPKFAHWTLQFPSSTTLAKLMLLSKLKQSEEESSTGKSVLNVSEIRIPLDSRLQPRLFYALPFHNKKNNEAWFTNLTRVDVTRRAAPLQLNRQLNQLLKSVNSEFLSIETENRIIDSGVLRASPIYNESYDDRYFRSMRGIDKQLFQFYRPDSNGMFNCLYSNQKIPFRSLNDDYCDCVDGSDEPGTSACPFATFYCSTQNQFLTHNFIPSSRVDDGVCDCCDGSDESKERKCPNVCDRLIETIKSQSSVKQMALAQKKIYLSEGANKNEKEYGPGGVFYMLSKKCFEIERADYKFELCPYKRSDQIKKSGRSRTNIGNSPSLTQTDKLKWVLKMQGGDGQQCGQPRETEIHFECGLEDKVLDVNEPQKCLYVFHLQTPAAC